MVLNASDHEVIGTLGMEHDTTKPWIYAAAAEEPPTTKMSEIPDRFIPHLQPHENILTLEQSYYLIPL
jgi:hypothetical protein